MGNFREREDNGDGTYSQLVKQTGSYVRLSTEPKPTNGIKDGDDLLLVDTKEVFIFYKGTWYLQ